MPGRPLILITNDDGIESPGLHAAAKAVADLGDLLVVAPRSQRTGAGRSYPPVHDNEIYPAQIPLNGSRYSAYTADVSPAQAVILAALELAQRPITLCISGINHGENIGSTVTSSGTVGAAIEAVCMGIPALAVSMETPQEFHHSRSSRIDFGVAAHFTRRFAAQVLNRGLPPGVDLLKIDVPASATPNTPWRVASISRQRYYHPIPAAPRQISYQRQVQFDTLEPESDVHVFAVDRQVAVVPMTIDMTAPVMLGDVTQFFNHDTGR